MNQRDREAMWEAMDQDDMRRKSVGEMVLEESAFEDFWDWLEEEFEREIDEFEARIIWDLGLQRYLSC